VAATWQRFSKSQFSLEKIFWQLFIPSSLGLNFIFKNYREIFFRQIWMTILHRFNFTKVIKAMFHFHNDN
jgi:hypothetical protein